MKNERITRSMDSFTIEVYDYDDAQWVDICRSGLAGRLPGLCFEVGDKKAGLEFLGQLTKLMGLGEIKILKCPDEPKN